MRDRLSNRLCKKHCRLREKKKNFLYKVKGIFSKRSIGVKSSDFSVVKTRLVFLLREMLNFILIYEETLKIF